jgi:hypothetical protein
MLLPLTIDWTAVGTLAVAGKACDAWPGQSQTVTR